MKWGLFGTGYISDAFAEGIRLSETGTVYAIASRDLSKAEAFAEKTGAVKAYGSYEKMMADEDIDIFYIGLPNHLHLPIAEALLKNKRPVLCEKPLAINFDQTKKLVGIAKQSGVFFMEAMWTRCFPVFKKAQEWVKNGDIGKIKHIQAVYGIDSDNVWRQMPEYGGGALLDIGIYPLAATFAFLGMDYDAISGVGVLNEYGVDVRESFSLKYGDAVVSIFSALTCVIDSSFVIYGDKGKIEMTGEWFHPRQVTKLTGNVQMMAYDIKETEVFEADFDAMGMQYEVDHVGWCIQNGLTESPLFSLDETLKIAQAMETLRKQFGVKYPADDE